VPGDGMRKKVGIFISFCLLFSALGGVSGQEGAAQIFAPFVTQFHGEIRGSLLRLSWKDSPDVRGPVYIYRSRTPISLSDLPRLNKPVEIPYGVQSYIDEPIGSGLFYYYASASDAIGRRYDILIPFSNSIRVDFIEQIISGTARGEGSSLGKTRPPTVDIKAVAEGDGVTLTFNAPRNLNDLMLYRSVHPLRQFQDLLLGVIVETGIRSPYIDYPVPGIPYYYTIIRESDFIQGSVAIVPGENTTLEAVEIPGENGRVGLSDVHTLRSMPLPLISLQAAVPGLGDLDDQPSGRLSPQAAVAVASFLSGYTPPVPVSPETLKNPRAFSQDLQTPTGGEEYTVRSIVQGSFARKDWPAARDELRRFLSLPRTTATEFRARFYLGQALFFCGDYRNSLFEFLRIQDLYPDESREWIQVALSLLSEQSQEEPD